MINPIVDEKGSLRVVRSGFWDSNTFSLRASVRSSGSPATPRGGIGFRIVRNAS